MRKKEALAFCLLFSLAGIEVSAASVPLNPPDTVYVTPSNPTPVDSVTLLIYSPSECYYQGMTQIGNLFQIHTGICPFETSRIDVPLGRLPAGSYQYEIYEGPGTTTLRGSGSFVVTLLGVPTLSTAGLAALLICLAAAGCFLSRTA
jgi:hypothetical protein